MILGPKIENSQPKRENSKLINLVHGKFTFKSVFGASEFFYSTENLVRYENPGS